MNHTRVPVKNPPSEIIRSAPIASALDYVKRGAPQASEPTIVGRGQRDIYGYVRGLRNTPIASVQVELHIVGSLKMLAASLSDHVLSNFRKLFLEAFQPIDLYCSAMQAAGDTPQVRFSDIAKLPDVPGYELLAAAAKSHADASFRQLLGNNPAIFQPLLCYYHPTSLPAVCSAIRTTDAAGFFTFSIAEPDETEGALGYRFVVRRAISSSLYISLYNPSPSGWYTYWNWPDEDVIELRTYHPLALDK